MEEAAPQGSHIVVMDDNIKNLVVEIPDDSLAAERKAAGIVDWGFQTLTRRSNLHPLMGTGLSIVEEPDVMCFLRGVCPELEKKQRYSEAKQTLKETQVTSLNKFKRLPAERMDNVLQRLGLSAKKRRRCLQAVKDAAKHSKPPRLLTRPFKGGCCEHSKIPELAQLVRRAGKDMRKHRVRLWGVNPSRNHWFLKARGDCIRERAATEGIFQDFSTRLGLVYGAWFGFRVTHNPGFYTRSGRIKDDVERTLRYWHADHAVLRYVRYGADKKCFKPGQFSAKKGGISASSSQKEHSKEAEAAVRGLVKQFGAYVRLPKGNEKTSCGLVWSLGKRKGKTAEGARSKRSKLDV